MGFSRGYISCITIYLEGLKQQLARYKTQFWMKKESGTFLPKTQEFFGLKTQLQLQPWVHSFMVTKINNFEVEFRFLSTFLSYVTMWTNASRVVQNLDSLDLRIEVVMLEMRDDLERASNKNYILVRPHKLIALLSNFLEKIKILKSKIREAYDQDGNLSSHSILSVSPLHHWHHWQTFVISICDNLEALSKKLANSHPLMVQFGAFKDYLARFLCFIKDVRGFIPDEDSRIEDLFILVGDVAIHAAHLSCLCWFREGFGSKMAKEIALILSDLQHKIDLTTPEFLKVNLQFLKAMKGEANCTGNAYLGSCFVKYLLGGTNSDVLYEELNFLVSIVTTNTRQLSREDVESLLPEIEVAIMHGVTLKCMLDQEMGTDLVLMMLLAKVWLIRVEVFLMEQLNGGPDLNLAIVQYRDLDARLSFLRTYFKDLPQAVSDEEDEQPIFAFLEEVNRPVISLYHSIHDKEVAKSMASDVFFMSLLNILLFKAESTLAPLLRGNASLFDLVKDQVTAIHLALRFWRTLVIHQLEENTPIEKLIFTRIFSVSKRVISLYKPILDSRLREEMEFKMYLLLCNLLDEVMLVKADLGDTHHQFPRHNFLQN